MNKKGPKRDYEEAADLYKLWRKCNNGKSHQIEI
jgi:hypothetical protein